MRQQRPVRVGHCEPSSLSMASLAFVIAATLAVMVNKSNTEEPDMVWPKTRVNVSESYLPAVVQVLTYLMEEIYDLAAPPESSETTETATSTSGSSETLSSEPPAPTTTQEPSSSSSDSEGTEASGSSPDITTPSSSPSSAESTTNSNTTVLVEQVQDSTEEVTTTTEVPTVRPSLAYVMLGRLRDILANESKRQGFSKIQGFSPAVLDALVKSSYGTSVSQLRTLLCNMLTNNDVKRKDSLINSKAVLAHLNKPSSYLVKTLQNVSPLSYSIRI